MSAMIGFADLALIRDGVYAGEWWRLWTGHLAHTGARHLGANLAAMVLLGAIAFRLGLARAVVAFSILSMPLVSIGLFLLLPELQWYAGLSGVLHGLVALIMIASITRIGMVARLGLGLLGIKLALELYGVWPTHPVGFPVIVEAHALGFACGVVAGCLNRCAEPRKIRPAGAASWFVGCVDSWVVPLRGRGTRPALAVAPDRLQKPAIGKAVALRTEPREYLVSGR